MIPCAVGMVDPERERQRLRDEYSRMMDGELEQMADAGDDLTGIARDVLLEELSRRRLPLQPRYPPAPGKHLGDIKAFGDSVPLAEDSARQNGTLCVVRRFLSFAEALIAKAWLDSAGIPCSLADENVLGTNPHLCGAFGGMRLFVNEANLSEATKLLDEPIASDFYIEGLGKYVQPRCPQCSSLDISFSESGSGGKVSLPLGLPLPLLREEWLCYNCGSRWTDTDGDGLD